MGFRALVMTEYILLLIPIYYDFVFLEIQVVLAVMYQKFSTDVFQSLLYIYYNAEII